MSVKVPAAAVALGAAIAAGGVAAARSPTPPEKAALTEALRSGQGEVAIQAIAVSTARTGYATVSWGFATAGGSAKHSSLFALAGGRWKVLWTREAEQPADGACVYVPARVAHDLLRVTCPPAARLHGRPATPAEAASLRTGFLSSPVTPYAKTSTGLSRACVSRLSPDWAAAIARFESGGSVYVWFRRSGGWKAVYESFVGKGTPRPAPVILSLASCVGYNPSDFDA